MVDYAAFIESKKHRGAEFGFAPVDLGDSLFPFQEFLVDWALRKGRGALFADCGLGKTPMQLTWAKEVAGHTRKPVLTLTPLAVGAQTVMEGEKFGIDVTRSQDGSVKGDIVVTNYERLENFSPDQFGGVVCDESSILKSFDGSLRGRITTFMKRVPYRLLCTATAAPNDYIELGTSSEAIGYLGYMDMLNRFFKNDNNNSGLKRMYGEAPKWRFKGHAEIPFWRWVTSWARACRKPSDLGFEDGRFQLPPLHEVNHVVDALKCAQDRLFTVAATTLPEQREERKRTIHERCDMVRSLVSDRTDQSLVWCHLNDEGDLLEQMIPDSVQISGSDKDHIKEERFMAFANGEIKTLITKPKIGAWGLNFQSCNHIVYFPSHSYEQYYQAVRRCWRFGQQRHVTVDLVMTEGELRVMENLQRKSAQADKMFDHLIAEMNNAIQIDSRRRFDKTEEVPTWL